MLNSGFFFILYINILYLFNLNILLFIFFTFCNNEQINSSFFFFNKCEKSIMLLIAIVSGIPPFIIFFFKFLILFNTLKNFNSLYINFIILSLINILSIYFYFNMFKFLVTTKKHYFCYKGKFNNFFNFYSIVFFYLIINILSIPLFFFIY